jgi:thiamine pyrophosphokinase
MDTNKIMNADGNGWVELITEPSINTIQDTLSNYTFIGTGSEYAPVEGTVWELRDAPLELKFGLVSDPDVYLLDEKAKTYTLQGK